MNALDCTLPGTKWGKRPDGTYCPCDEHREYQRSEQRKRDRRRRARRGQRELPNQLGGAWVLGVNALDAAPLTARLTGAGLNVDKGKGRHDIRAGHPFPELVPLIRRTFNRGWLTLHEADLLCIRGLGCHPFHVFGAAWDALETGEPL